MSRLVMKFGGTSVGRAEAIRHVIAIVQEQRAHWDDIVVITSAIRGVTDGLVTLVRTAVAGDMAAVYSQLEDIREKHYQAARELIDAEKFPEEIAVTDAAIDALLKELQETCDEIVFAHQENDRLRDAALSMGERLMSRILSAIFRVHDIPSEKVDASEMIVTNTRFQNAQPQDEPSRANAQKMIIPLLEAGKVPVVTGYIGATPDGHVTTFGRGGSDYSASYLGFLIDADEVWIWTDVDGVMSADPRQIKEAQVMQSISYEEVSEFAHFGAKVLHPRAVEPLIAQQVPLRVCNTFNASHPGTRIVAQEADGPRFLRAVTSINGVLVFVPSQIDAEQMLATVQKVLTKEFSQETRPVITVDSHSGHLLCYVVPTTARRTAMQEAVQHLHEVFTDGDYGDAWRVEPLAIVAAIGVVDVKQTVQVLNAVKTVKADLLAMGHGSPECTLLAVAPNYALPLMKRLHRLIEGVQMQLFYEENNPTTGTMPLNIPINRRRRSSRQRGNDVEPPHRVIPL